VIEKKRAMQPVSSPTNNVLAMAVPEPATMLLLGSVLIGLAGGGREEVSQEVTLYNFDGERQGHFSPAFL